MSTRRADLIPEVHASTVGELRAFHEAAVTRAATYLEGQIEDIRRDLAAGRIPERPIVRGAAELDRAITSLRVMADMEKISTKGRRDNG